MTPALALLLTLAGATAAPAPEPASAPVKAPTKAPARSRLERSKAGAPMVEMVVRDVITPPGTGEYVVLLQEKGTTAPRIVPISIGPAEGLAISMRLARQQAPRPLTHDLIDKLLASLGARLIKVHVEDLREAVFLGRIFLVQGGRRLDVDARPSDALALAVGAGAPVFCARKVIDEVGLTLEAPPPADGDAPPAPPAPSPWDELRPQPRSDDTL